MKNTLKNTMKLSAAGLFLLASPTYANESYCTNDESEVNYKTCDSQVGWYIGGQLGNAQTDISQSDIDTFYGDTGFDASSIKVDDSDLAFSLMAGYQFNTYWAIEGSYIDLGERSVGFTGRTEDLNEFYDNIEHVYPQSGDGLSIALVGSWPISENIKLSGKLGYWRWEGDYSTYDTNGNVGNDSIKGNDLWFGAELNYRLTQSFQVYLSAAQFELARDKTNTLSVGIRYFFGGKGQSPTKSIYTSTPQTALTETVSAQKIPVEVMVAAVGSEVNTITEVAVVEQDIIEVVRLPDDFSVYFDTDKDGLNQAALTQLTQLNILLAQRDDINISVSGYASTNGNNAFNKQLSQWRAHNVQKQLYLAGIDLSRITIDFYGDNEQTDTKKSQRVDIGFSYSGDKKGVVSRQIVINFGLFSNKLSKGDVAKITKGVAAQDMNKLDHIELVSYEKSPGNTHGLIELAASRANAIKAVLVEQEVNVPVLINYLWLNDDEQTKERKVDVLFFSKPK